MPESLRLIPATDQTEWTRWLAPVRHDFYHTAAFHLFSEHNGEGQAFLAVYGAPDRYLAWPYLLRPIDQAPGLFDVTSVYGYPGPLAGGSFDDAFLQRSHAHLAALWSEQHAVSAFTRFHPLLENHRWSTRRGLQPGGETVSLDLTLPEPDNWRRYQASLRNRINRGRRLGIVTEPDPDWSHLGDFVRFYHAAMRRNGAASRYFFSFRYFQRLREALGAHAFLLLARLGDRLAAAALLVEYGGLVQNHFCMNNPECLELGGSKVLLDDVRQWAKGRGNRAFHLGGGRGSTPDTLFAFKAAFSDRRHPFYTGRWVLDAGRYDQLSAGRLGSDWFPCYRAELATPAAAPR